MGIRKIFEPRQADFSSMTTDPNVYVTNVEQSIAVTIKKVSDRSYTFGKYTKDETWSFYDSLKLIKRLC